MNLTNVVLSSHPCPVCVEANGKTMTMTQWRKSKYGVPGSNKRYCKKYCHCILVLEEMIPKLPQMGKNIMLRGDDGSDIKPVTEIFPNEMELAALMDEYNATIGKLPDEIYDMPLLDVIPYLRKLLGKG